VFWKAYFVVGMLKFEKKSLIQVSPTEMITSALWSKLLIALSMYQS